MATNDQRAHMLALCEFFLANRPLIGYDDGPDARPMRTVLGYPFEQELATHLAAGGTVAPDCSETVTLICKYAGLQDPSGRGYDGDGNTLTMYDHLSHYTSAARAHVGALVVFGAPTNPLSNQHVAMVMVPGSDPMLFSHGSTAGPIKLRLSDYESAEPTQTPVTFLDIGSL